jgi:hypothetical protein
MTTAASPSTNLKASLSLAIALQDLLTFRQMRYLCRRNRLRQYSYLTKEEMAFALALVTHNKLSRKHHVSNRKRTKV